MLPIYVLYWLYLGHRPQKWGLATIALQDRRDEGKIFRLAAHYTAVVILVLVGIALAALKLQSHKGRIAFFLVTFTAAA